MDSFLLCQKDTFCILVLILLPVFFSIYYQKENFPVVQHFFNNRGFARISVCTVILKNYLSVRTHTLCSITPVNNFQVWCEQVLFYQQEKLVKQVGKNSVVSSFSF